MQEIQIHGDLIDLVSYKPEYNDSKDGDAPRIFKKKLKFKSLPLPSLGLAALGLSASVITSLLLPGKIYAYITTAAGILQMYNWGFIIISAYKILKLLSQTMLIYANSHSGDLKSLFRGEQA